MGVTIGTLRASELREILFEIFPRKVSVDASAAKDIINEVRAFYRYLKRVFSLKQADACLKVLGGAAVAKLQAALSDTSKFIVGLGAAAGYDMGSKDGIESFMRSIEGKPFPGLGFNFEADKLPPAAPKSSKNRDKAKRKAIRKARKKNR